ncbi:MAG: 30S ribosomal protein S8 [Candidatus Kerfeldbacteria bacterium]|nr:30S ribosomal protein S8 [Candidatus Kerfeldbacteria bacterium]
MTSTDPIADLLSRIRNASMTHAREVVVPSSKAKCALAKVLAEAGWISDLEVRETPPRQILVIRLKYDASGRSVIRSIKRVSSPGRKVYVGRQEVPIVANNFGMAVISTSRGMMTNREARKRGIGGEVICEVF